MVLKFLSLGRFRPKQSAPRHGKVFAALQDGFIYQEILLLRADSGVDGGNIVIAK